MDRYCLEKKVFIAIRGKDGSTHKETNIYLETQYMQCLRLHPALQKKRKQNVL